MRASGPAERCPCGSGRPAPRCCGADDPQALEILEAVGRELELTAEDRSFLESGERIAATEDAFELVSVTRSEVVAEISRLPGAEVEHDAGPATVIGLYAVPAPSAGPRLEAELSVSARELLSGTLTLEAADRVRARLEQLLGSRVVHRGRVSAHDLDEEVEG